MAYLHWHYFTVWPTLFVFWRNLALFPFYYFSIPLHLSTLFSPWKRQRVKMKPGFHLDDFANVVGFNLISRLLGAVIRSLTVFYGLVFMVFFTLLGAVLPLVWSFLPFLTLPFYLKRKKPATAQIFLLLTKAQNQKELLLTLLKNPETVFAFQRLGLPAQTIVNTVKASPETGDINKLKGFLSQISKAGDTSKEKSAGRTREDVKLSDLLETLSLTYSPLNNLLSENHLTPKDLGAASLWYEKIHAQDKPPLLLSFNQIKNLRGIGVEWAYGYTVGFDQFASDLTKTPTSYPLLVGREKEIELVEQTLIKTEGNNVLLVGQPGVARHQLIETLAHRIATGNCLPSLSRKRILSLDMHALTAAKPSVLEVKGFASEILEEAEHAGNIIVFVDDMDKFLSSGVGRIDLTDVFAKFAQSSVGLIGITTPDEYHKYIEPNSTLSKLFEKIDIFPVSTTTLIDELEIAIIPVLEKKYSVFITYQTIIKAIEDCSRYLSSTPFPGKAIELLDETAVYCVTQKKKTVVAPADVDDLLSVKLHVKIGDLAHDEKWKLGHLEELIHKRVINQETAVHALSSSLRRARLQVSSRSKPVGTFLFLGPTGVGKTETAKALAEIYFGSEDRILRFDMSQYQSFEGLQRLIGSQTLGTAGELTSGLRDNPFSLLLLDEFEKAEKQIDNLFLTLLDEGYITDGMGKKADAKNAIIIATSNAGSEFIREKVQSASQGETLQEAVVEYVQKEKIFSPEFLNRFDSVVVFTPLSEGHLREVARLQLESLNKRLAEKQISVKITPQLVNQLVTLGFDPQFGGRSIKRKISETIEDIVAQKLLSGEAKKGEAIEIDLW